MADDHKAKIERIQPTSRGSRAALRGHRAAARQGMPVANDAAGDAAVAMTEQQKRALVVTAAGLAGVFLTQVWRRRGSYDFAGKSVLITGGSRGLGLVLARELVDEGARVALVARDEAELMRAAEDLHTRQPFADVLTLAGDIRRREDAEQAVAQTVARFGRIDVLINNAGIIQVGPFDHMKVADYENAMQTHFWGPLYAVLAAVPHMRTQGGGRIVNISSIGGRMAVPHLLPYCASKFALTGLSDGLRIELARDGIAVTTVCPGLMRTGSPLNAQFKGRWPQEYAWFAISDSLPLATIDAGRAARQILNACRRGSAELVITVQAKAAILARTLAPELFADLMTMMNGLLPEPAGLEGNEIRSGRESESAWAPSRITAPTYRAAAQNNEL
jgi:NAD(P)-dependent dehydrogenase (short-subunit alcohol dehydrogenase family)